MLTRQILFLLLGCRPPDQLLGDSDRYDEPNFGTSVDSAEDLSVWNINADSSDNGLDSDELQIEVKDNMISVTHGIDYYESHDFIGSITVNYAHPTIIVDYGIVIDSEQPTTTYYALSYDIDTSSLNADTYTLKIQVDIIEGTNQSAQFIDSEEFTIE